MFQDLGGRAYDSAVQVATHRGREAISTKTIIRQPNTLTNWQFPLKTVIRIRHPHLHMAEPSPSNSPSLLKLQATGQPYYIDKGRPCTNAIVKPLTVTELGVIKQDSEFFHLSISQ